VGLELTREAHEAQVKGSRAKADAKRGVDPCRRGRQPYVTSLGQRFRDLRRPGPNLVDIYLLPTGDTVKDVVT
jgi:hypothetical protein